MGTAPAPKNVRAVLEDEFLRKVEYEIRGRGKWEVFICAASVALEQNVDALFDTWLH